MFSNIKKLKVFHNKIEINDLEFQATNGMRFDLIFGETLKSQSKDKEFQFNMCNVLRYDADEKTISISANEREIISFYAPREFRYAIYKDLNNMIKGSCFNLAYRKHFRALYSKFQSTIQFFNFIYPGMLKDKRVLDFIHDCYDQIPEWSRGNINRPTVIFVADILTDYTNHIEFNIECRIIAHGKVVYSKKVEEFETSC